MDLFKTKVDASERHKQFESLRTSDMHQPVRAYINQLFAEMGDPTRSFRGDFQSRGFHSRMFELACFAYLKSAGLIFDRRFASPDFMVSNGNRQVAIEATTANAPQDADQDISMLRIENFDPYDDAQDFEMPVDEEFPGRMAEILREKLKRRYHKLAHVSGKPIVLMAAPFHGPGSVALPDGPLLDVLYPTEPDPQTTPFFWLPGAENISAVAYCNSFTVPRFLRLANYEYLAQRTALRTGLALFENDPLSLKGFRYQIGHELTPAEVWSEGVTLFFNPRALAPLSEDFLPSSSQFVCVDDVVQRRVNGFHPLFSRLRVRPRPNCKASVG